MVVLGLFPCRSDLTHSTTRLCSSGPLLATASHVQITLFLDAWPLIRSR